MTDCGARVTRDRAHAGLDRGARGDGGGGELAIEERAIDDCGADPLRIDHDRAAVGRDETRGIGRANNRATREAELFEGIEAEHARAMDRRADDVVLFEDADANTGGRQLARGNESRRPGTDDDHITIGPGRSIVAIGQYLRPRDSHVPRKLIQNESRIKRRSSHIDCCRT